MSQIRAGQIRASQIRASQIRASQIRASEISSNHRELHGAIFVLSLWGWKILTRIFFKKQPPAFLLFFYPLGTAESLLSGILEWKICPLLIFVNFRFFVNAWNLCQKNNFVVRMFTCGQKPIWPPDNIGVWFYNCSLDMVETNEGHLKTNMDTGLGWILEVMIGCKGNLWKGFFLLAKGKVYFLSLFFWGGGRSLVHHGDIVHMVWTFAL